MIAPETLLRMHPLDAVRAQIGEIVKTPLKAQYLKISPPTSLGGLKTRVTVSIDKTKAPLELWDRVNSVDFEYQRLSLPGFVQGLPLSVRSALPSESHKVLRTILEDYDIPVDSTDLVDAIFTDLGSVDIISNDKSWRWVGEFKATLTLLTMDITQLILVDTFTIPFDTEFRSNTIKARLTQYINMTSPKSLPQVVTVNMFDMGVPEVYGNNADGDNTKVSLTFKDNPYSGVVDIYYSRRAFEHSYRLPVKVSGPGLTDMNQMADALSMQMGCTITASDLKSTPFPTLAVGESTQMAVDFNAASLAYTGSVLVTYSRTS